MTINPTPVLLMNHWVSAKLVSAFILLCKIYTLRKFLNFTSEKKFMKQRLLKARTVPITDK